MRKLLSIIIFSFSFFRVFTFFVYADDGLLEQAYDDAFSSETVVDVGTDTDTVWTSVFKWWKKITIWEWISNNYPMLVKISKLLLKITIVIAISMIIITWYKYVLTFWDQWKMKEARDRLYLVWLWIVIALWSVALIFIINSITRSSISI